MERKLSGVRPLLTQQNAKTSKGEKLGFLTGVMYMAPWKIAGVGNVCPHAEKAGCHVACLYSAGRGQFNSVQQGRIRRTKLFYEDRDLFMAAIVRDIHRLIRKAERSGLIPLVRLNGTSDIRFERIPVTVDGVRYPSVMHAFPDVQFYDYTKLPIRFLSCDGHGTPQPPNYDLTFSYSGLPAFAKNVALAVELGMRVAVVFRDRDKIPAKFMGVRVVDGDDTDVRHLDPQGVIAALYAKGKARKDMSGFVVG